MELGVLIKGCVRGREQEWEGVKILVHLVEKVSALRQLPLHQGIELTWVSKHT